MSINRLLPAEELVVRQLVTIARLVEREQTPANGGHDLGLPTDDPTLGLRGRQIRQSERRTGRTDDVLFTPAVGALLLQHGFTPFPQPSLLKATIGAA